MPSCPNCQADTITDAQYCEACGYRLTGVVHSNAQGSVEIVEVSKPQALPGSLRAEIPFLSGAMRQAKARLESWKEQAERDRNEARREHDIQRQEREEAQSGKKKGRRSIWLMLAGVAVLALWVWIILRWPPSTNPAVKWQMLNHMLNEIGWFDYED